MACFLCLLMMKAKNFDPFGVGWWMSESERRAGGGSLAQLLLYAYACSMHVQCRVEKFFLMNDGRRWCMLMMISSVGWLVGIGSHFSIATLCFDNGGEEAEGNICISRRRGLSV